MSMRGYVTFILVLASVFLLLNLISSYYAATGSDKYREIAVVRAYQLQLNLKDVVLEAAKTGAEEGLHAYLIECTISDSCEHELARKAAISGAQKKLNELEDASFDSEFQVELWCGAPMPGENADLKRRMAMEKKVLAPGLSFSLSSPVCTGLIDPRISKDFKLEFIGFAGPIPDSDFSGVTGVSVYSEKFAVSGIGYIPNNERRSS